MASKLFLFALCGLLMASGLTLIPLGFWWIGPLTSFHVQYLVCSLIAAGILGWQRKKFGYAFLLAALGHGITIAPSLLGEKRVDASEQDVRVFVSNVLTSNQEYAKFMEVVQEINPDVLVLTETSSTWLKALKPLQATYPQRISHPRSDNFGLAVWSRIPLQGEVHFFDSDLPTIVAEVEGAKTFTLVATHPIPPVSQRALERRNKQLQAIARFASECATPVVVAGDLNTASWSPALKDMREQGSLKSAASGWIPTWPVHQFLLWIPLDHILYSEGIGVSSFSRTRSIGSDHYPVIADLRPL